MAEDSRFCLSETPWVSWFEEAYVDEGHILSWVGKGFLHYYHINGETGFLCAKVKGKQIVMTLEVWEETVGLSSVGRMFNDKDLKDPGVKSNKIT